MSLPSRAPRLLLALLLLLGLSLSPIARAEREEIVYFNTNTHKYHCLTCEWAIKCTKACIRMKKSEAERQGVPCKTCHGSCKE